jgi:protein-disulfide isomerase
VLLLAVAGPGIAGLAPVQDLLVERTLGKADAPITLTEFSSLTCPHCASFHREILPQIKKEYVDSGKVRLVYRDFPLDSLAYAGAMLARCVARDRYFAFLETLFASQSNWARSKKPVDDLEKLAKLAGLSKTDFDACLDNQELLEGIRKEQERASAEHNIRSTPTFLVNGEKIEGAADFPAMKQVIDKAIAAVPPPSAGTGTR